MEPIAIPKAAPDALPELAAFLAPFAPLFRRTTTRQSLQRYVTGLLTDLPRKNCDTIAAAVAGTSNERLQHLLTDAGYGDNPAFLAGLESRHLLYVVAVNHNFGVRRPEEVRLAAAHPPTYQGRGQPKKPRPAPLYQAEALLARLPASAWQPITWRQGEAGPLRKHFAAVRVHWGSGTPRHSTSHSRVQTSAEGWLLGERPEAGERAYYYSSLPVETPLARLVEVAHSRWPIEQFYEDAKGECGLYDYKGRGWDGLHRHLALVMLAYSFLALQRGVALPRKKAGFSPLQATAKSQQLRQPSAVGRLPSDPRP